jgi:hypothetical protein
MKALRLLIVLPFSMFAGLLLYIAEWVANEPLFWYSKRGKNKLIEALSETATCTECGHVGALFTKEVK